MQVAEDPAAARAPSAAAIVQPSVGQPRAEHTTGDITEAPLAGRVVYQAGPGDPDSDDEDEARQPEPAPAQSHSTGQDMSGDNMFADEHALNEEVERLMLALQGSGTSEMASSSPSASPSVSRSSDVP